MKEKKQNISGQNSVMGASKIAAKQNSEKIRTKKYQVHSKSSAITIVTLSSAFLIAGRLLLYFSQERDSRRRMRRSIKKLRTEMEEIRAEVELIRRRQKHVKGESVFQGDKTEIGRLCRNMKRAKKTGPHGTAANRRELLKVGMKEIGRRKHQKRLHLKLRKEEKFLQRMEAKAAQARSATSSMREETTAMIEAMDDKKAELELLRVLHLHLFNDIVLLSETEEEGMEILLS